MIPKHDWLYHILNNGDEAKHSFCYLNDKLFHKKSKPSVYRSGENYHALSESFQSTENHVWWPKKTIGAKILRLGLDR